MPGPTPVGVELRWMRQTADLSGPALATRLGISQPFLSQIETGKRQAAVDLVERWYAACLDATITRSQDDQLTVRKSREVHDALERLQSDDFRLSVVRMAEDANTEVISNYVITRTGLAQRAQEILDLDAKSRQMMHFQPLFCPGPLQTREYAELVFAGHARTEAMKHMPPAEREAALEAAHRRRMERATKMRQPTAPEYSVIVTQRALELPLVGWSERIEQDLAANIAEMATAERITIRVIPATTPFPYVPVGGFVLYDLHDGSSMVLVETYAAQVSFTAPRDVRMHVEAWNTLADVALTPDETIKWLTKRSTP